MVGSQSSAGCSLWGTSSNGRPSSSALGLSPARLPASGDDPIPQLTNLALFLENQNQINSQNPHFVSLRNQAINEGNLMKQKFDEAHRAYDLKDGARAKALSNQAKAHQERRNQLNKQAADWIFKENNRHVPSDTIDLHGLYVQESLSYAENFINRAERNNGPDSLRIIVGKGLHSQNFQAKLKPAIEKLVQKHHLAIDFDNHNAGVLLVRRNVPRDRVGLDRSLLNHLSSDTHHSGKDDGCIIV